MTRTDDDELHPDGYVVLGSYGQLAIPMDLVPQLHRFIRLENMYSGGKSTLVYTADQTLNMQVITTKTLRAIIVAHKLEEGE